jgi:hypothetical protein
MKDNDLIDLVLGHKYSWNKDINRSIGNRVHLFKRRPLPCIHQENLTNILMEIQSHYFGKLLPLYYEGHKVYSKKWNYNMQKIKANQKILNTLIQKINKYRLKHWYWEPIDVSTLY